MKKLYLIYFLVIHCISVPLSGQEVMQWNFENTLNAASGEESEVTSDEVEEAIEYGTTEEFSIPPINGSIANVVKIPGFQEFDGIRLPMPDEINGAIVEDFEPSFLNDYTLILDVLFPEESNSKLRPILEINPDFETVEFFVSSGNQIGAGGFTAGSVNPNEWNRLIWTVDTESGSVKMFINGLLVGDFAMNPIDIPDGQFSINPGGNSEFFMALTGQSYLGYVSSLQLRTKPLSPAQIAALGGPEASGIPLELPPVPSYLESFIPSKDVAVFDTELGVLFNSGTALIQEDTIEFFVNDKKVEYELEIEGEQYELNVTTDIDLSPGDIVDLELRFKDDIAGDNSWKHTFDVAFYSQDFEDLDLGPNVDESTVGEEVWTDVGPEGWDILDEVPVDEETGNNGVDEWAGWSFADYEWWVTTAGDQDRSKFTKAEGAVLVIDPDEWDDQPHGPGEMNSFLTTAPIDISQAVPGTLLLQFDSSWRPYSDMTGTIDASFDDGEFASVIRWESQPSSEFFKGPDFPAPAGLVNINETVVKKLNNPEGAQNVRFRIGLENAGNDWWWAMDNFFLKAGLEPPSIVKHPEGAQIEEGEDITFSAEVSGGAPLSFQWFFGRGNNKVAISEATNAQFTISDVTTESAGFYSVEVSNPAGSIESAFAELKVNIRPNGKTLFFEDFENVELGPNVNEGVAGDNVWSKSGPEGWSINDEGVPGVGDDSTDGVTEWAGWSFANRDWWVQTAGDQQRSLFKTGQGTVAISDGDEWDDQTHDPGELTSILSTPEIDVTGIVANSMSLSFSSAWRPYDQQKAIITAVFDGDTEVEVVRWESDSNSNFFKADNSQNENIVVLFDNPEGAKKMVLHFTYADAGNDWYWAIDNIKVRGQQPPVYFEDFESVELGPNVDEGVAGEAVWSGAGPDGWIIDDSGVPGNGNPETDGVTEWAGWGFANKDWWVETAEDQGRARFELGTGTVAIADGDEWDDAAHAAGKMTALMTTPEIDISDIPAGFLVLNFDSSWNPYADQKAIITASYDGGEPVEILRWESSDANGLLKTESPNESVRGIRMRNPEGAKNVQVSFTYADAGNDWYWALDNIMLTCEESNTPPPVILSLAPESQYPDQNGVLNIAAEVEGASEYQWFFKTTPVADLVAVPGGRDINLSLGNIQSNGSGFYVLRASNDGGSVDSDAIEVRVVKASAFFTLLAEDFENMELGPNIDEALPGDAVVSVNPPAGWSLNDEGVPGNGDPDNDGVTEWAGWGFANKDWWVETAEGQGRGNFLKGIGTVAIGDGDEWDDATHAPGEITSELISPVISLDGVIENSMVLKFDSIWRPYDQMKGIVSIKFDDAEAIEVIRWESDSSSPNYKPDQAINWDESVSILIDNPTGAQSAQLIFTYADAGNDWFWAVDNIELSAEVTPFFMEDFESIALGSNVDEGVAADNVWSGDGPSGWIVDDSMVPGNGDPSTDGVTEWAGWGFANKDWWVQTAEGQARGDFLKGTGTVAIADGDEWDDASHAEGEMTASMSTPQISLEGIPAMTAWLRFDSIWRPWDDQKAIILASYDGNDPIEILRWESQQDSGFFKADAAVHRNETVTVPLYNPDGASNVQISIIYADAGNDWYWAIDNIQLISGNMNPEIPSIPEIFTPRIDGNNLTFEFIGILESAPSISGPWTPVPGAQSPFTEEMSDTSKFYRIVE